MKPRGLVIALSLLANIVLALGLVWRLSPPAERAANTSVAQVAGTTVASPTVVAASEPEPAPDDWQALTAGSLPEVAARLQAHGFPPRLQRVILRALVTEQFADRHRALADTIRARRWWGPVFGSAESAQIIRARQQLHREEGDVVDALLGPDTDSSEYIKDSRLRRYGPLPPETQAAIDRINADYIELANEMKNSWAGIMLPEDREKLLFLARQQHTDVAELLTPEELFEYDLRSSPEGWWLRELTSTMDITEAEYRALFKVRFEHHQPFSDGQYELLSQEDRIAIQKLEPQLNEKIKATLTPERFAEYELKTSHDYRTTDPLVKRLGLPPTATAEIVTLQEEITKRADDLRANASLSASERNAQLTALAEEAVVRLKPTLGEAGLSAYQQGAGRWLATIQPPAPTPATPKG